METTTRTTTTSTGADPGGGAEDDRRSAGRMVWLVLGGVLAVASLVWGTFQVISLLAHGEYTREYTFSDDEVTSVEVRSENGSVTVVAAETVDGANDGGAAVGTAGSISVRAEVNDGLRATDVDVAVVDGVLDVSGECPVLDSLWCSVHFTVTMPAGMPVTVDASDGSVLVRGMSAPVDVDTDDGRIELDGLTGNLEATNDNGSIVGRRLTSPTVRATTGNGSVDLVFIEPPDSVTARTGNGRIEVEVPDADVLYRVETHTGNGGVDNGVRTDPNSDRVIDLRTGNGSITVRAS